MKKMFVLLLAGFMLTAFTAPVSNTKLPGDCNELNGFKVKQDKIDHRDFNLWVITGMDSFKKLFEPVHDSVLMPVFDNQVVIAALVETINNSYRVKFIKLVQKKDVLNVYFTVSKKGPVQESASDPAIIAIAGAESVKKVNFWYGDVLIRSASLRELV